MNFLEVVFMLQLGIVFGLFLFKLYNIFRMGEVASISVVVLTLIAYIITWGIGFIVVLHDIGEDLVFYSLFKFETWFFILFFLFFIVELFLYYRTVITGQIEGYRPPRVNNQRR